MLRNGFLLAVLLAAVAAQGAPMGQRARTQPASQSETQTFRIDPVSYSLFQQLNKERVAHSLRPLAYDMTLARAAEGHLAWLLRHPEELSHQFAGEPDLLERAAKAGAHLSVVAENLAIGPDASTIHSGWMHSPHHRDNILDERLDAVGFAVAESADGYVAVADYGLRVQQFTPEQVEAKIAELLRAKGIAIAEDNAHARAACPEDDGVPQGARARFIMRWQSPDLSVLPNALVERLPKYQDAVAEVASCPAQGVGGFTSFRIAVLLN